MRRCGRIRWWAAASLMMAVGCGEGGTERHDAVVNLFFRVREGGYVIDRIVLSREAGFVPENLGPDETRP